MLEQFAIIVELVFHLPVGFEIILFEDLPFVVVVMHVLIKILKERIELIFSFTFQSRQIFKFFDPNVPMEG